MRFDPIRKGDSLRRTYYVYDPLPEEQWANPDVPEQDITSPVNLTGATVTWNLYNNGAVSTFTTASGLTITPLLGKVVLLLTPVQTDVFAKDRTGNSYINVVDTAGIERSFCHQRERVFRQDETD